ncbi:hypothetical protein [Microbacterium lacticum]
MHSRRRYLRSARSQPRRAALQAVVGIIALIGSLVVAVPASAVSGAPGAVSSASSLTEAATVDSGFVKAAAVVGFNPENIISDALFYDGNAMSAAEIQSFLDSKIGRCENGKCLNVLTASISSRDAWYSQATGDLVCSALQGGTMRVSELIYRVQVACGISAKVILVTLQKEQGLTTSSAPSDWNLRAAMGASCPDTEPCDPAYSGVGPQIVQGVRQLKIYKAGRFAKQPGVNFIGYNPNSACGGTNINIQNYATAALYNYTPYQPNAAALAAGWGLGDGCSSYGNRNFYNYYTSWFGSTQGGSSVNDPVGFIDGVTSAPGEIVVSGWTLDPDSSASISVHVYVDGVGYAAVANKPRPDLAAQYPGLGVAHGYVVSVPPPKWGTVDVCAYGINVGAGSNRLLACRTVPAYGGSPVGSVDSVIAGAGTVTVSGWTIDPDTLDPISVHVYVGSKAVAASADAKRDDVAAHYPQYGNRHGFSTVVPVAAGYQQVCVYGINVKTGGNVLLSDCTQLFVRAAKDPGTPPVGNIDSITFTGSTVTIRGWALDPDSPDSIAVHAYVGTTGSTHRADGVRNDIARAYPGYGVAHGFTITRELPAAGENVCVYAINDGAGSHTVLGCSFQRPQPSAPPFGSVDSFSLSGRTLTVRGWALDPDTKDSIPVHVYVGAAGTVAKADGLRKDVGNVYPAYGPDHGYNVQREIPNEGAQVCVYAINDAAGDNTLLGCQFMRPGQGDPVGSLDSVSVSNGIAQVSGWAFDPDSGDPLSVHIYVDRVGNVITANTERPDVAGAFPGQSRFRGFAASVAVPAGGFSLCAYAINVGPGGNTLLGCRTF